jgi:hypothetical protein
MHSSPPPYMLHILPISSSSIWLLHSCLRSTDYDLIMQFSPSPVTSSCLGPNTLLRILYSDTLNMLHTSSIYVLPSGQETKFTHPKQWLKYMSSPKYQQNETLNSFGRYMYEINWYIIQFFTR